MKNNYIPGTCNIGKTERRFRRNGGILGLLLTTFFLIIIITFRLSMLYKLIIFFPVFISTISFLQYQMHFCAEFGILGKYNFTEKFGNKLTVEDQYLQVDRIKAIKIIGYSVVISLLITFIVVVVL